MIETQWGKSAVKQFESLVGEAEQVVREALMERDSMRDSYNRGVEDRVELMTRNMELESLVRDMWAFHNMPSPYMPAEIVAYFDMEESIRERIEALGLLEGDAE